MNSAVEHLVTAVGDLHRPSQGLGSQRCQGQVVIGLTLPAEPAADITGEEVNPVRRNGQSFSQGVLAAFHHLDRGMDRDLVTLPPGGGGARFHLHVVLDRAEIGLVNRDRCRSKGTREITDVQIFLTGGLLGLIQTG